MKCLICQHETVTFTHPQTHIVFHECSHCKVIFKDMIHWPSHDDELKRYKQHHNSMNNQGYLDFLNGFISHGVKPFIKDGHVLDFGSGPEAILKLLLDELGYEVTCYDPFFEPKLPENQVFDMITATEVIEHIQDPMKQLDWIDKHLKKGGYFSMMTLLYPEDRELFYKWFYIRDITHIIFFHSKTYAYLAQSFGWKLIKDDKNRIAVFQKR